MARHLEPAKYLVSPARRLSFLIRSVLAVDNTLSLLHTSSIRRGLADDLTRNLAFFRNKFVEDSRGRYLRPVGTWKASGEQQPVISAKQEGRIALRNAWQQLDFSTLSAVGEVLRMAEGTAGLSLGRLTFDVEKGSFLTICPFLFFSCQKSERRRGRLPPIASR
jgi:hypothetical protein